MDGSARDVDVMLVIGTEAGLGWRRAGQARRARAFGVAATAEVAGSAGCGGMVGGGRMGGGGWVPGRKEAKKLPEREPFPGSPLPLLRRFWRATPTSNGASRDIGTFTLAAVLTIYICREGFRCSGERAPESLQKLANWVWLCCKEVSWCSSVRV